MKHLLTGKIIIILLAALFTISNFSASSALALGMASFALSPSTGTFNQGCSFSVGIVLNTDGSETDGADAILKYDPTRFTATSITNGTIYADYPGNGIDITTGKVTVSGLAPVNAPFKGQGVLATVNFTVLATAPAGLSQITFDFDPQNKSKTSDSNVAERQTVTEILNSVTNGNYTVGTGSCGGVATGTTGTTDTGTGTVVVPTKQPTVDDYTGKGTTSGVSGPTIIVGLVGGLLTILGIIGFALF